MSSMRDKVMAARSPNKVRLYPLWTAWRLARPEHVFSEGAMELARHVLTRRDKTFSHVRNSPSAGNVCERASVISFMGYKSSAVDEIAVQQIFDNGNFIHLKWQMYLHDMGVLTLAEVPLALPSCGVVGTCDGIVQIPTGNWYDPSMSRDDVQGAINSGMPHWTGILEIKGWNAYKWRTVKASGQPDQRTRWQGDLYHLAGQHTLPDLNIEGTCYWLENKENSSIQEYDLACTDVSHYNIHAYYGQVLENVDDEVLPERPHDPDSTTCKYCPVSHHCERLEAKGKTTLTFARGASRGEFNGERI